MDDFPDSTARGSEALKEQAEASKNVLLNSAGLGPLETPGFGFSYRSLLMHGAYIPRPPAGA